MRFDAEHRFDGAPGAVAAVLADPDFYVDLALPDLSLPEVVEHGAAGQERLVVLRYEYTGHLDPIARRLLGGGRLTWLQEVRVGSPDGGPRGEGAPGEGTGGPGPLAGSLVFRAEANPGVLHGDARFTLTAERSTTVRRLEGEVVVAIPVMGGMAEQRIVPGVRARLDIEAAAVNQRLDSAGPPGSPPGPG
jgi:hypothetical protein